MLSKRVISILKEAGLYDKEKLQYKEDWELGVLPYIGPAAVKRIRKDFGQSIFSLSAKEQASFLNIPYDEILSYRSAKGWSLDAKVWVKKPEFTAREFYRKLGCECECGENYTIRLLMEALMYPLLRKYNVPLNFSYKDTITEKTGFLSVALPALSIFNYQIIELRKNEPNKVIETISTTGEEDLRKGLDGVFRHDKHENNPLSNNHLVNIWRILGKKKIMALAYRYVNNIGYIGWPDLTLVKNNKLFFSEVKASDKLFRSQVNWWLNVAKPVGLNFQISRVCFRNDLHLAAD